MFCSSDFSNLAHVGLYSAHRLWTRAVWWLTPSRKSVANGFMAWKILVDIRLDMRNMSGIVGHLGYGAATRRRLADVLGEPLD